MKIEKLPKNCIGSKVRYYVTYSFENMFFDKATRGDYCKKHHVGELVEMRYLEGSTTILRANESATKNLISFGVVGLLGIAISVSQWLKIRSLK